MIFDCAERYDPVTKQWAAVASMNSPRCGLAVCACHAAIYALGESVKYDYSWFYNQLLKTAREAVLIMQD